MHFQNKCITALIILNTFERRGREGFAEDAAKKTKIWLLFCASSASLLRPLRSKIEFLISRKPKMSLFSAVEMAPRDPILGLNEQFNADTNPNKVNLGVGVYYDDNGKLPLLKCVQEAEKQMAAAPKARGYLPIDGIAAYDSAVKGLVFGADSEMVKSGRVATVQGIGGTGGLKIGADFLKKVSPNAKVLISDPSWENHRALFAQAGFVVESYPYYDAGKRGVNFEGMLAALKAAAPGTIVVLHACCHNPTGYDISASDWDQVIAVVKANNLTPFLDMAYQGFGYGIAEDGAVIGKFVAAGLNFFVSTSFSKSFSLYGERVGALSVACESKEECDRVLSQLKIMIRTNYSNPPTHGGTVCAMVLNTPDLRKMWEEELAEMRVRIKAMRSSFVEKLKAAGVTQDMSFITTQIGMFSYSGLSKDQMVRLRNEFGVYGTDTGRMCVAALNSKNIDHVCASIAKVM
jgi:aromatic-amino-acid transaminase